ncbi:sorting nexin-13-like isoform X2 [Acanthaster planci]|uniref:Sorting nexin-13-like isoform X2 n=1 Tax=Acanthaster planci TaxID=133434 RepID=A0A8B7XIS3_ACAPL|nr:sorting nexin-13-like isoform X2 [Acanthaster planci]
MGEIGTMLWVGLAVVLFLATFGVLSPFLLVFYIVAFFGGGVTVLYNVFSKKESQAALERITPNSKLENETIGLGKLVERLQETPRTYKSDKRLTGAKIIDGQLQEVLLLGFRDYIHPWYHHLSDEGQFLYEVRQCTQSCIINLATKSKEVDWVHFFTRTMVDDFATHVRMFRRAQDKVKKSSLPKDSSEPPPSLESIFFDFEVEMENDICRELISMNEDKELEYLQSVGEILLFLLVPDTDFRCKPFRLLMREIIVCEGVRPLIDMVTDPDYINQTIVWLCADVPVTTEAFLTVIKMCCSIEELDAVVDILENEIHKQRSRDANRSYKDESDSKQQLNSLQYLKQTCNETISRILAGEDIDTAEEAKDLIDSERPGQGDASITISQNSDEGLSFTRLYSLPLDIILINNIAVSYFIDFMRNVNGQAYVFFWHTVEGFRAMAEQQLSELHLQRLQPANKRKQEHNVSVDMIRKAALNIFQEYLAEDASNRVKLGKQIVQRTYQRIKSDELSDTVFDDAQRRVHEILQEDRFFPAFKQSSYYVKCLEELDLLKGDDDSGRLGDDDMTQVDSSPEISNAGSSEDLSSMGSQGSLEQVGLPSTNSSPDSTPSITANITHSTLVKEKGTTYAVYSIHVTRTDSKGVTEIWDVYRRFSDFHDLHMCLTERFENLASLTLPSKRAIRNTAKSFVDKRGKALTVYLQTLLNPDVQSNNPGMQAVVCNFLEPGVYNRSKGQLARKMDHIVNPLKTGVRNVAHTVRSVPSNLVDGVNMVSDKMTDSINKVFTNKSRDEDLEDLGRVSNVIRADDDDNIPLRIMLLLMDEVFDLKSKDQWLRRQVATLLRQIIKAAFGSKINSKIVESVEDLTSPEQVANYVKQFRESFWPGGVLAESSPQRSENVKLRTLVAAKVKLFSGIPDELKNFIGTDTSRRGMLRLMQMLQNRILNKRLLYVVLEGLLTVIFRANKFTQIFRKLHGQSPRVRQRRGNSGSSNSSGKLLQSQMSQPAAAAAGGSLRRRHLERSDTR